MAIQAKDFSTVGANGVEFHLWELRCELDVSIVVHNCDDEAEAAKKLDRFLAILAAGKSELRRCEREAKALESGSRK